jgi:general secretion pathway protein J
MAHLRRRLRAQGFTLIELLVAITVMSLLALLSWRGLDAMVRAHEQTRQRADAHLVLQTALAQWSADLDAIQTIASTTPLDWDGQVLRLTRRSHDWPDTGALVVAWTRRNAQGTDQWLRWQSPPLQTRAQWQQAWDTAALWARSPSTSSQRGEVALLPLVQWRLLYFRGGAWTNPQSSADSNTSTSTPGDAGAAAAAARAAALPDGIRLEIDLPPGQAEAGRITRDWFNPLSGSTP